MTKMVTLISWLECCMTKEDETSQEWQANHTHKNRNNSKFINTSICKLYTEIKKQLTLKLRIVCIITMENSSLSWLMTHDWDRRNHHWYNPQWEASLNHSQFITIRLIGENEVSKKGFRSWQAAGWTELTISEKIVELWKWQAKKPLKKKELHREKVTGICAWSLRRKEKWK